MQRGQQFQPLAVVPPGDQRHFAAAQAVIGQRHRPGRAHAFQFKPRDTGAHFRWQDQRSAGLFGPILEPQRQPRQHPLHPIRIAPMRRNSYVPRRAGDRPQRRQRNTAIRELRRAQADHRPPAFIDTDRPVIL